MILSVVYIFVAFAIFFITAHLLRCLFRKHNLKKEQEMFRIIESSKSHFNDIDEELMYDEELVAVITSAIYSFEGGSGCKFVIKSIKESKASSWSFVDRLGNNSNFRL